MITRSLLFFFILAAFSCSRTGIQGHLEDADALVVQFHAGSGIADDPANRVVETTDKNAIRKMANQLDGKPAPPGGFGCKTPDGIMFFQSGSKVLLTADFYLRSDCRFLVYPFNNTMQMRMISTEGADFLQALKDGKHYY
jgi:hypothetical protein